MSVATWKVEIAVVAAVLSVTTLLTGDTWRSWLASAAVLLTFAHAQIADRLAEREAARARPEVECYRKAKVFFVAKETLWVVFFLAAGAWPALIGCGIFLAYPVWRRVWRRWYPLQREQPRNLLRLRLVPKKKRA